MRKMGFAILIVLMGFVVLTCNKNREKIAQLEKEVREAELRDTLPTQAPSVVQKATAEAKQTPVEPLLTPDKTPDEDMIAMAPKTTPVDVASGDTRMSPKAETEVRSMAPELGDGYTVQIGSGIDAAAADLMASEYKELGYEAFVSPKVIDGITFYRVRIGDFEEFAEALRIANELQEKYSINFWIDKSNQ